MSLLLYHFNSSIRTIRPTLPWVSFFCYNENTMTFSRAAVFYNVHKPQNYLLAEQACAWLRDKNVEAELITSLENLKQTDVLICMGGDGTILRCARAAAKHNVPIFGVNCGTLGFLAACEKADLTAALNALLKGNSQEQARTMLDIRITFPSGEMQKHTALNDCVLRAEKSRALTIEAHFDKRPIPPYFGDGVLVSTPTGSTAYSLAAGGPIITPGVDVLLVTPICPHTLNQRPLILPQKGSLELHPILKTPLDGSCLSIDGQINLTLPPGSAVTVSISPVKARLLTMPERDFFFMLSRKLSWGSR